MPFVRVKGLPDWVPTARLLGPGEWTQEGSDWTATLDREAAADLGARLRGMGLAGRPIEVEVRPPLKRALVRRARTVDAARRRATTPGFRQPGVRLDAEGRMSLTPEDLALEIGRIAHETASTVIDATCGAGGNAIGFARAGCEVVAIDTHGQRLADAGHNAELYGVAHRIEFIRGRAEEHLAHRSADLLFVDPPWGSDWSRTGTGLADLPVLGTILAAAQVSTMEIWAKVPPSFDLAEIPHAIPQPWFGRAPGDRRRIKFILLRLPRPQPS